MSNALPKATHKGTLTIGETGIRCFVLDNEDGEPVRLLSGRAVTEALGLSGRGPGMTRFVDAKWLRPFINSELENAIRQPIRFVITSGIKPSDGYKAEVLPHLCYSIIDAYDAGKIHPAYGKTYLQAKILARAFSTVGINALVDEATGFQEVRDRRALQNILNQYIAKEWQPWIRTFPDDFYKELFRLKGWQYRGMSVKRPQVIGHLTNDLVYRRLAPGILEALKQETPRNEQGRHTRRFHQKLTDEVGRPALLQHLHALVGIMRVSSTWSGFMKLVDKGYPRYGSSRQFELPIDDEE